MYEKVKSRSIIGPLRICNILALAGLVGPSIFIVTDLTAAISQPEYSAIRDSISSLAWSPMGWLQTIGFIIVGLLVEVFAVGLFFSIHGGRGFGLGIGLLVFFGFGLLLIGAFHTDLIGGQQTTEGLIHTVAAKVTFSIFPIASILIAFSLRKDSRWKGFLVHTAVTSSLAMALVIGHLWLPDELSWFGLYERILVANTVVWVAIIAIHCLRLSFGTSE